jgi:hypothetical protein
VSSYYTNRPFRDRLARLAPEASFIVGIDLSLPSLSLAAKSRASSLQFQLAVILPLFRSEVCERCRAEHRGQIPYWA